MNTWSEEPPDTISAYSSFDPPPQMSPPGLLTPTLRAIQPPRAAVRRRRVGSTRHLAVLLSHLLAAPTEEEARRLAEDGLCSLLGCRDATLRLLDDPPDAALAGLHRQDSPSPDLAVVRIPVLADHHVTGTLMLGVAAAHLPLSPTAHAAALAVARALAVRLAHLRLLVMAASPTTTVSPLARPAAPLPRAFETSADRTAEPSVDQSRLGGVCEALADAVLITDAAGRVVLANGAFQRLFALRAVACGPGTLSADLLQLVHQVLEPVAPAAPASDPDGATECFIQRAPVRRVFERHTQSLRTAAGTPDGMVILYRDITHQHDEAVRQQAFLAQLAHEMRTPLTSVTGYAQLLLRDLDRSERATPAVPASTQPAAAWPATARARLTAVRRQAERMNQIVQNVLDTAHLQASKPPLRLEPVEMVAVTTAAIAAARVASPPHRITLHAPPSLALRGDTARLRQIVRHLLENAVRFSPDGGPIHLTLRHARRADGAGECVLLVRDHGIGIPAGLEEAIFTRHMRPAMPQADGIAGIGLSLPLCRVLAARHGGALRARPTRSRGALFELRLPLAGPPSPAP